MRVGYVILSVAILACGSNEEKSTLPTQRMPSWYPKEPKEAEKKVTRLEAPHEPRMRYDVVLRQEDTLERLSEWSGHTIEELLKWNPEVKRTGLNEGDTFVLYLTPSEFAKFSGMRKAFLAASAVERSLTPAIERVIVHRVEEGETVKDILAKYRTSLDLLERLNPNLRLTALKPGQEVNVPILSRGDDSPSMPGPKPPSPPPVPVPPPSPSPITVQPEDGAPKAPIAAGNLQGEIYVVQPGDRAWTIAVKRFNISLEELAQANPSVDLDHLRPGTRLIIPKRPQKDGM